MKYSFYSALIVGIASLQAKDVPYAITYELNGGRLGDNIQSFSQAFWLSYMHDIPLLFQPFEYSNQLKAHYMYPHYTKTHDAHYKQKISVKGDTKRLPSLPKDSCLYVSKFEEFPGMDWHNEGFITALCEVIRPVKEFSFEPLPCDMHTIAMHVRRGGGFWIDDDRCRKISPRHFPNLDYYANALNTFLNMLDGPCYVFLFTDDPEPAKLSAEIMAKILPEERERITIDFRRTSNRHDTNVLEDFFNIMRFTYLIRARSGFSLFAERLGNCRVSIEPTKTSRGNPWGNVHEVCFTFYTDRTIQHGSIATKQLPIEKLRQKDICKAELASYFID
ncbi:MAG TPA: hypothetical protein VGW78_02790 [Candidatus Babeliales bacterium]|jgi:hypothetical protein|nr:hypothetical protein [Candidatus Babeliales bacterium]